MARQYHDIKIETDYYQAIERGQKFVVTKKDRDFNVYDVLSLRETVRAIETGRVSDPFDIKYIFHGDRHGLKDEYCILCW